MYNQGTQSSSIHNNKVPVCNNTDLILQHYNVNTNNDSNDAITVKKIKKTDGTLNIMTVNVRGVKSKLDSLETLILTNDIDIVGITESHLQGQETVFIDGYQWIGKNRETEGGGIGFLIKKKWMPIISQDEVNKEMEILWIHLKSKKNVSIGVYYGLQENVTKNEIEREYRALSKIIEMKQKNNSIILLGDFNAKIKIEKAECKQSQSRNGKLLKNMMKHTNTVAINTLPQHEGTWTRINTKNSKQRSIIDYIVISKCMEHMIIESNTDTDGTCIIEGKTPTDHRCITVSFNLMMKVESKKIKRWKTGTPKQWKEYNNLVNNMMKHSDATNVTTLTKIIVSALTKAIGRATIVTGKERIPNNKMITAAKYNKKVLKKKYNETCKTKDAHMIQEAKAEYIESQKKHREEIEKALKDETNVSVNRLMVNDKVDMNTFWKTRRHIMQQGREEFDIIDEDNKTILNPMEAKEHVAGYFEDLYQARAGDSKYDKWTKHIEDTVEKVTYKDETITEHNNKTITIYELDSAIKCIQRRKASGPDDIPNEAIIEADESTRKHILQTFNEVYRREVIPKEWREGHIIRLYKGKGKKGKCSNERGITLSSNLGKLFERIINHRIQRQINITNSQGGGKKGVSTADHIKKITTYIKSMRKKKKTVYITFLDVTKAYDKAWLKAIIYALNKSGIEGKELRIARQLNEQLTARIETKHGTTRPIEIRDSIRQGGVLSVVAYANLMDEISKELQLDDNNLITINKEKHLGCLLWMDDVVLMHTDKIQMQHMLDVTYEIANRYRIKFGEAKSKTMTIGKEDAIFTIGETNLEQTEAYTYLGVTINQKGNLKHHINQVKGKCEASTQAIMSIARHRHIRENEMMTMMKLHEACTIPMLLYGTEGLIPTKAEQEELDTINYNIMKRILNTPQSTSKELIMMETDQLPIQARIDERQVMYYMKKQKDSHKPDGYSPEQDTQDPWSKRLNTRLTEYKITEKELTGISNNRRRQIIKQKLHIHTKDAIMKCSEHKSKVKYVIENNGYEQKNNMKGTYMMTMNRHQCAAIFAIRTRMLDIKGNFPYKHQDLQCRWCNDPNHDETQKHIMEECLHFKQHTQHINMKSVMNSARKVTAKEAHHMTQIYTTINECKN